MSEVHDAVKGICERCGGNQRPVCDKVGAHWKHNNEECLTQIEAERDEAREQVKVLRDAVENAEAFEQLRAMTVECPCHETENGYAGCKSCVVDKATMAYYEDDGSVSHEGCLNCQGTGLVPRFPMMWENCSCIWDEQEHARKGYIGPRCDQCIWTSGGADHSPSCFQCNGTRRISRTPTSEEVEDALYASTWAIRITRTSIKDSVWELTFNHGNVEGTDPRHCRLLALVALAQEKNDD